MAELLTKEELELEIAQLQAVVKLMNQHHMACAKCRHIYDVTKNRRLCYCDFESDRY